ncbi:MAG: DNA-directed RNA polymerase subunit omega [Fibrobacterota bacterium]|jgi:DNA-directed RNA polymerase subunit K/omega
MANDARLEMNLDKFEKERGISRYKAVVMAAKEARFLREQQNLGIDDLNGEKPETVAIRRLYEGKVVEVEKNEEYEE